MKLNKIKLVTVVSILLVLIAIYNFGYFNFVGYDGVEITPIKTENLTKQGAETSFKFNASREKISGVVLDFYRLFFLKGEDARSIEFEISCFDKNDQLQIYKQTIPESKIVSESRVFSFDPISCKMNSEVKVAVRSFADVDPAGGFFVKNKDTDPDMIKNNGPKIIYRQYFKDLGLEFSNRMDFDKKFKELYTLSIYFLVIIIILLSIISEKNDKRKKIAKK